MIKTISLSNFKGFESLRDFEIKPLTVLCGTNSSGKSSILQSILLLKQTLESQMPNQLLLLNGRLVHLGPFEELVFDRETDRRIGFNLKFSFNSALHRGRLSIGKVSPRLIMRELTGGKEFNKLELQLRIEVKSSRHSISQAQLGSLQVELFEFSYRVDDSESETKYTFVREAEDWYKLSIQNAAIRSEKSNIEELRVRVFFQSLVVVHIRFEAETETKPDIYGPLFLLEELLKSSFSSYTYLGPLREQPARRYIYEDEVIEIGTKGENAPYIYLAEMGHYVHGHFFYDKASDTFERQRAPMRLGEAVRDWLELMGIKGFNPQFVRDIIYVEVDPGLGRKQKVSIAGVGFGVSQIFPIILEGLRMPSGGTLLLEQPEIHLHPNLQMKLADYFVSLAKSNKNIIVETHSDHIINRLVRRIMEDTTGELERNVAIYFVSNSDSSSILSPIDIDPLRGIVNWPVDFFDQNATEQELIIKTALNNRRKAKMSR